MARLDFGLTAARRPRARPMEGNKSSEGGGAAPAPPMGGSAGKRRKRTGVGAGGLPGYDPRAEATAPSATPELFFITWCVKARAAVAAEKNPKADIGRKRSSSDDVPRGPSSPVWTAALSGHAGPPPPNRGMGKT